MLRPASHLALGGLLLLTGVACGGGDRGGERFELYHLETAIGPPGADGELRCGPPRAVCPGVITQRPRTEARYHVLDEPEVEDDGIDRAGIQTLGASISIPFTAEGTAAFRRLTREIARHGGRDQGWHHVAVVVGDEIVAFPEVDFDVYPDGFPDAPGIQIAAVSEADARDLVERLRDG